VTRFSPEFQPIREHQLRIAGESSSLAATPVPIAEQADAPL
jgi:hypothetical protein